MTRLVLFGLLAVAVFPPMFHAEAQVPTPGATEVPAEAPPTPREAAPREVTPAEPVPPPPPPPTVPSVAPPAFPAPPPPEVVPRAAIEFRPSLVIAEEYTDNFDLSETRKRSNFRTFAGPGFRLLINTPRTRGGVVYTVSGAHDSATDDIEVFQSLLGRVTWEPTPRFSLEVSDALTRSDRPAEADQLGLRRGRATFTSNTFALASSYLIGAAIQTRQSYRLSTFFDETGADTITHALGGGVTLPLYRFTTGSLAYEYLTSDTTDGSDIRGHQLSGAVTRQVGARGTAGISGSYALRTEITDAGETDFQLWTAAVFSAYASARLTLTGSLGVSAIRSDRGQESGPNVFTATSLTYRFARATATLAADRGFSETFAGGENFGVVKTQGVTGSLIVPLATGSGTVSAFYRESRPTGIGGGVAERVDTWGGSLGLSFQLRRWLRLDLSYSYLDRSGSITSYTENRARSALLFEF